MIILRIISFIALLTGSLFFGAIVLPFAFLYSLRYFAIELIPAGMLLDGYFSNINQFPVFTTGAFVVVLIAELGKKYLRFSL